MKRTILVQEVRKMRFEQAYEGWTEGRLSQHEAAQLLGVCERSFRRYCSRYEQDGLDGLIDRRLAQVSHRRAQSMKSWPCASVTTAVIRGGA